MESLFITYKKVIEMAMYRDPIVPEMFDVPQKLELEICDLIPLTIEHAQIDYDAIMDIFEVNGNLRYPNHTIEQNTADLGYHQKEFQKRASFTYTILKKDHKECLGCLYIYPCTNTDYDAEIDYWLRDKYKVNEKAVFEDIKNWISEDWPFKSVYYAFDTD